MNWSKTAFNSYQLYYYFYFFQAGEKKINWKGPLWAARADLWSIIIVNRDTVSWFDGLGIDIQTHQMLIFIEKNAEMMNSSANISILDGA